MNANMKNKKIEKESEKSIIDTSAISGAKTLCLQKYASFAGEPVEYMQFAVVDEGDSRMEIKMVEGKKVGKAVMSKKDTEIMTDHAPILLLVQTNQKIDDVLLGLEYIKGVIYGAGKRQKEHAKEKEKKEGGKGRGILFHVGAVMFCVWNLPKTIWDRLVGMWKRRE